MPRILQPLTLLLLGGYLYSLILRGTLARFVNEQTAVLVLASAIVLLLMAAAYLQPRVAQTAYKTSVLQLLFILLPVIVGGIVTETAVERGTAEIIYLSWDSSDNLQLFKTSADGEREPQKLTQLKPDQQVTNFSVSPDGELIAYTVQNTDRSSDIWTIDRDGSLPYPVLDCLSAACSNPVWSPDGTRIIYERRPVDLPGSPRLWWLDPISGESIPVFNDADLLGYGVQFSPNGRWFSFLNPLDQEILIYDLQTAAIKTIPSQTGEVGAWHPTANYFYYTDVQYLGSTVATHIFQANVLTGEQGSLTNLMAAVNDGSITWAPNGRYLAFGRQPTRVASGKQLWLMPADGADPFQLTDLPTINHGRPAWSPDSQEIAYQTFDTTQPSSDPSIWVININSGRARLIAPVGIMPQWLP